MIAWCKRTSKSPYFLVTVTLAILASALVIGLETDPAIFSAYHRELVLADRIILGIFVVELAIRIGARARHPWLYFMKFGNIFDFVVVTACLLPLHMEYLMVVRLFRVLRVLRLVTVLPRLQVLVGALLQGIPAIGYIALLLSIQFYVYAAIGVMFFRVNDPVHFSSIPAAMLTLFEVLTLEGWVEIFKLQMDGVPGGHPYPVLAPFYFVSFILIGTMIVLNLFVGVILKAIEEQQEQVDLERILRQKSQSHLALTEQIELIALQVEDLKENLEIVHTRIQHDTAPFKALSKLRGKRGASRKGRSPIMLSDKLRSAANN